MIKAISAIMLATGSTVGIATAVDTFHPWATSVVETTNTNTLCRGVEYLTTLGYSTQEAMEITLLESEDIPHPLVCPPES